MTQHRQPFRATRAGSGDDDDIRVMVVDDSAVIRGLVSRWLEEADGIGVCASAPNGESAIQQAATCNPDVVVLDIEMPKMDGITALPALLKTDPSLKIIMASTLTTRNAEISLKALSLGAADYLAKPQASRDLHNAEGFRRDLLEKVRALGGARKMRPRGLARPVARRQEGGVVRTRPEGGLYGKSPITLRKAAMFKPEVIGIGSSTGGPQALMRLFESVGAPLEQPVLITQHMPATFTTILAQHLDRLPGVSCHEAKNGEPVKRGTVYVAPGDHHMIVERSGGGLVIRLNQDPPENFCRPAVDPMFRSLAEHYRGRVLGVVLTGMGHDGLNGGRTLVDAGGVILAQDEPTSVVWGMPGAVATGGLCSAVLPLPDIGPAIKRIATGGSL